MALASLLGGLALANAGLGAVHGIAGSLGGMFTGAPHGAICAALLPASLKINSRVLREKHPDHACNARMSELASLVTGNPEAEFDQALDWICETVSMLAIPGLSSYGLTSKELPTLVGKSMKASSMKGNPIRLDHDELTEMIQLAR